MRRLMTLIAFALAASVPVSGSPEPAEPISSTSAPPPLRGTLLVSATASWRWQLVHAPLLAPQIGAHAISGLDVVMHRRVTTIDPLGSAPPPPARWPIDIDAVTAPRPDMRVASAWGVTNFTLDDSHQGFAMLELRVRYADAIVASLNGTEIARSALPSNATTIALARRPHGPEWETFYIPVGPHLLRHGLNTLALELHPAARTNIPTATVELAARRERGILRGPVLTDVTTNSAQITVDTDPDTPALLTLSDGTKLTSTAAARHTFHLTNLVPDREVRYRIQAGATTSKEHSFHTTPPPGSTIRVGVYGDVRGGHAIHRQIIDRMFAEPLDLIAVTGDMVLRGADQADWQRFFALTEPLLSATLYLATIGNHDLGLDQNALFALPPGPPARPTTAFYYSYDYADLHLVFLDSNAYEARAQQTWLDADLAAARARSVRAILVFTHDGPYSRGLHRGNLDARTRYVPILTRHRVDYLFSGHDHLYQRGEIDGLRYIVTGGGGASLYSATCGVAGKRACPVADGMITYRKAHHYLVVTIDATTLEVCARDPAGKLLEPCTRHPLRRAG